MKINFSVGLLFNSKTNDFKAQTGAPTLRPVLNRDVFIPSFCGKKPTLQEKINKFGKENIPERVLENAKNIIRQDKDDRSISLADVHYQTYEALKDCETLDDAKKEFPEFAQVLSVDEAMGKPGNRKVYLPKIKNGEFEGLTSENAALELLKYRYCDCVDGFSFSKFQGLYAGLIKHLNLPELETEYIRYIKGNGTEQRSISSERMAKRHKNPKWKEKQRMTARETMTDLNKNRKFAEARKVAVKKLHQRPEIKAKYRERLKKLWSNPVYRAIKTEAMSRTMNGFYDSLPENIQGVYKVPAPTFILAKKESGVPLNETETRTLDSYYNKMRPELRTKQSEYLTEWQGFHYKQVRKEYEEGKFKIQSENII